MHGSNMSSAMKCKGLFECRKLGISSCLSTGKEGKWTSIWWSESEGKGKVQACGRNGNKQRKQSKTEPKEQNKVSQIQQQRHKPKEQKNYL